MTEVDNKVVTLKVRVSPEFREKITQEAKANNRSMNAEIVKRLEDSFDEIPQENLYTRLFYQQEVINKQIKEIQLQRETLERQAKVLDEHGEIMQKTLTLLNKLG